MSKTPANDWGPWYFNDRDDPLRVVGPIEGTWYEARKEACAQLGLEPGAVEWKKTIPGKERPA